MIVTDIPGAFLHADMEGIAHMILEGEITELIIELDPKTYKEHLWHNLKGKPMIYVQLKKDYMELYKQHYYSGSYCLTHYRSGVST